jgi:hypothetical protein
MLCRTQISQVAGQVDRRRELLLGECRDAPEQSENKRYIELDGRAPADIGDQSAGDAGAASGLRLKPHGRQPTDRGNAA